MKNIFVIASALLISMAALADNHGAPGHSAAPAGEEMKAPAAPAADAPGMEKKEANKMHKKEKKAKKEKAAAHG